MKSYTDIEQSKKLAEFLSIESADSHYVRQTHDFRGNTVDGKWSHPKYGNPNSRYANYIVQNFSSYETIPCWSLAALLSILPIVYINNEKEVCGPLHIDITDSETPFVLWYVNILHKGNIVEIQTKEYDNLVDTCYEMIILLKEKDLL